MRMDAHGHHMMVKETSQQPILSLPITDLLQFEYVCIK